MPKPAAKAGGESGNDTKPKSALDAVTQGLTALNDGKVPESEAKVVDTSYRPEAEGGDGGDTNKGAGDTDTGAAGDADAAGAADGGDTDTGADDGAGGDEGGEGSEAGEADESGETQGDHGGEAAADEGGKKPAEGEDKGKKKEPETLEQLGDDKFLKQLKPETGRRFNAILTQAKEYRERATRAEETSGVLVNAIVETGMDANEYAQFLGLARLVKSGTPDGAREALKQIDRIRADIATVIGEEVPGVDLLTDFPDLVADVEGLKLTREAALKVASARRSEKRMTEATRANAARSEAQTAWKGRVDKAVADIDALGLQYSKVDLDYDRKLGILEKSLFPVLKSSVPPEQWAARVKAGYEALGEMRAPPADGADQQHTPLRKTFGRGGAAKPRTSLEAVTQALAAGRK